MSDFSELEHNRAEYRRKMTVKDGFTPDQQIAMATLHNQAVSGGSSLAISVLIAKPTLRKLLERGVIDTRCRLTKTGDDFLRSWLKEARKENATT